MRTNIKTVLYRVVIVLFVLIIVAYALFQARGVISGPLVTVTSVENGTTTRESLLTVAGTAERAKELTLNGRPILIDLEGRFYERLLLQNGYNIIELKATDVQNETRATMLEVIYDPN